GAPAAAGDAGPPRAVPFPARDPLRGATHHVVTAGDSYWAIAEDVLPHGAANSEVLRLTSELISLNTSKLGYDGATMLHPGDGVDVPSMPAADRPVAAPVSAAT